MFEMLGTLGFPAMLLLFVIVLFLRNASPTMKFAKARAFSVGTARRPSSLGIEHHETLEGPVRRGVLIPVGDGRYYVNADRWRRQVRTVTSICVAFGVALAIAIVT